MSARIEDYALIGDRRSAALVSRGGSVDWLCWPRFDSDACFAALLGDERHGCWRISPIDQAAATTRRYRPDTLILETRHATSTGAAEVIDLMPIGGAHSAIIRQVTGESGELAAFAFDLALRFDYGADVGCAPHRRRSSASSDRISWFFAPISISASGKGRARRQFLGQARADHQFCSAIRPILCRFTRRSRSARGNCRDRALLAQLGATIRPADRLARCSQPIVADPACAEPPGNRRHCGSADNVTARNFRRQRQLGLPLQLASRFDFHLVCAA